MSIALVNFLVDKSPLEGSTLNLEPNVFKQSAVPIGIRMDVLIYSNHLV